MIQTRALTGLRHGRQVGADAAELGGRHDDGGGILGLRDAEVLLVDVHELEVILAYAVVLGRLEDEVERVGRVLGLERQDVLVLGRAQHLRQGCQVHAQRDVAVAPVRRECLGLEHHGHERHVRVVHGLQRDARVIAVEVAVLHQVLDGIDNLSGRGSWLTSLVPASWRMQLSFSLLVRHAFFRMLACSNRPSSILTAV